MSAREVFDRLRGYLSGEHDDEEVWAEDVVVETPFAAPGRLPDLLAALAQDAPDVQDAMA
ncbi:hypothetical protein AB0L44_22735 [Nonomuraea wenchangensis]|uniref:hypothetical protein n=1 Tax=Nonomuraea wenchangensis TaxID=568860 RepID=UPI00343C621E